MQLPTIQEIKTLHKKYAPSDEIYDLIWTHCQIIRDIALQLYKSQKETGINFDLVQVGSLLHDIGVYPLFGDDGRLRPGVHYITHGVEGEKILKDEGFPEIICRFASHHTGVGLTVQDITSQQLPLPVADFLAETDEELLVMYADKFHSKTRPPTFNRFESYRQEVSEFGAEKADKFKSLAQKFGKPELGALSKRYGHAIQ